MLISVLVLVVAGMVVPSKSDAMVEEYYFQRKSGILHQSQNFIREVTCIKPSCTDLRCALACTVTDGCLVFSKNPTSGTCILNGRNESDPNDYDVPNPAWDTYYRMCPTHKGYRLYDMLQPPLCLRLVKQGLNFSEAQSACQLDNANLVRTKTSNSLNIVKDVIQGAEVTDCVWVGAEDQQTEMKFYWNDGTRLYLGTPLWNDNTEGLDPEEDCVCVYSWTKLVDTRCSEIRSYVCQYDV